MIIEGSERSPYVHFDSERGVLEIKGKSIPENPTGFYQQLLDWVDNYIQHPQPQTYVYIALEYFNTSSAKSILDLFKKLDQVHSAGKSAVDTHWVYESDDIDMLEAGQDYQRMLDLPMQLKAIERFDFS